MREHEEAIVGCPVCEVAWQEMPEECEAQVKCDGTDETTRADLVSHDGVRMCSGCAKTWHDRRERADQDELADRESELADDRRRGYSSVL